MLVYTCLFEENLHIFLTLKYKGSQVIWWNMIFNIFGIFMIFHIDLNKTKVNCNETQSDYQKLYLTQIYLIRLNLMIEKKEDKRKNLVLKGQQCKTPT